jgi:hypothetical protein
MRGSAAGRCRAIFAERLPGLAAHYARRTERLDGWFRHVSFALGGEAGSRLLRDLGVVSGDTLLNHIRSLQLEDHETPRVLSVDDFAFRRGTRYGTVLVDLERRVLVDVLCPTEARTRSPGGSETMDPTASQGFISCTSAGKGAPPGNFPTPPCSGRDQQLRIAYAAMM